MTIDQPDSQLKRQPHPVRLGRTLLPGLALILTLLAGAWWAWQQAARPVWSEAERAAIESLWIGNLGPVPPDPSNRVADDPAAAALGEHLFFDARLSANGAVACATCHQPAKGFQDGIALGQGIGTAARRTMPLVGAAYSPWYFWDGRSDSQWAQAFGPLENPVEHGGNRTQVARLIAEYYRADYESIFGPLADLSDLPEHAGPAGDDAARAAWNGLGEEQRVQVNTVVANAGKALAAYQRTLLPVPTRFDRYVEALRAGDARAAGTLLSEEELNGLRLFVGRANCTQCHNGPLLTNHFFHNTGVPPPSGAEPDPGRALGMQIVLQDEFNCLGPYSDAAAEECTELRFMPRGGFEFTGAFKVPGLRDVAGRAPYMSAGQIATLEEVMAHYNAAPVPATGHTDLRPLGLTAQEQRDLVAFLRTLSPQP